MKLEPNHDLTVEALREMDKKRKIMQLRKVVTEGRQAFEAGAFDRAAKAFSEAIELNAKNVAYVVYRALTYLAAGDSRVMSDVTAITNVDSNYPKDGPILSGYMSKQGKGLATGWKSRFFILKVSEKQVQLAFFFFNGQFFGQFVSAGTFSLVLQEPHGLCSCWRHSS